jgi:hypothetical protein
MLMLAYLWLRSKLAQLNGKTSDLQQLEPILLSRIRADPLLGFSQNYLRCVCCDACCL